MTKQKTKCTDQKCPKKKACDRYTEEMGGWQFTSTPRTKEGCNFYIKKK